MLFSRKCIWIAGSAGSLGQEIAKRLPAEDYDLLKTDIDLDITNLETVRHFMDMQRPEIVINCAGFTDLDACEQDIVNAYKVNALGARNLDGVVVAVADDMEASIMATLVSKEIGVPYVLAKAKNELHAKVLKKIGADSIIFPEKEIGQSVARNLVSGEFVDWISLSPDYSITEIQVPEKWIGKSLSEIDVRRTKDVNVVGVRIGEKIQVTIDPEEPLQKEMMLIMIGSNEALEKFGEKQVRE